MSKDYPDRSDGASLPDDGTSCAQSISSTSIHKHQPQHQKQLTSRYGIPLKRNPSLNSTTSSITNGTSTTYPSRRSLGGSKTSNGSKEKVSVDDILSNTKYALSARKTWTREEVAQAKNVKLVKTVKKANRSKLLLSPSKYNFPSREECLRRLGSPIKGAREDTEKLLQNKSAKRNMLRDAPSVGTTQSGHKDGRPKRSSPRLKKSDEESKSVTPDELSVDTSSNTGIEITAPTSAARPPTKQTAAELISSLLETYSTCLEGAKTPWEVVQLFPPLLDYLDKDDGCVREGLSQFVKSLECVRGDVMNRNSSDDSTSSKPNNREERLLRLVQIQIWARIMMWNFSREDGWRILKQLLGSENDVGEKSQSKDRGKRKKGKKKSKAEVELTPSQSFVQDIIKLFELVPYVLPPSMEFAQWLKDTLTFGFQQSIPEFGMEILDHFEVEFVSNGASSELFEMDGVTSKNAMPPMKPQSSTDSRSSKPVAKGKAQQQAYFSSLARKPMNVNADGESATIGSDATIAARSHRSSSTSSSKTTAQSDKEADATLFKTSVSLTAAVPKRKENPFLKNSARGVYVGSHFSSKLSNISSLFREVKAPSKPKPTVITAKRKDPPKLTSSTPAAAASAATIPAAKLPLNKPSSSAKPSSALAFINNKYNTSHQPFIPSETPRKRLKPMPTSRHPGISVQSTSKFVAATPLQIIGETPAKQTTARRDNSRLSSSNMSSSNNNHTVGATPLQIIGETPHAKQPGRGVARRLRPNALDGVFVRHSAEMTPRPRQYSGSTGDLCFGLSPMPQQGGGSKAAPKDGAKKWN